MPEWLTMASAAAGWLGAFTGTLALWINWLNRRDAVRDKARTQKAKEPWATLHHRKTDKTEFLFRVAFHNPIGVEFTITELLVVKPRGGRIVVTYSPSEGATDLSPPAKMAPVDWLVWAAGSRGVKEPSGTGDFRLTRMVGGLPLMTRVAVLGTEQVEWEIVCKGETSPPMRDPIRISAKATTVSLASADSKISETS